MTQQLGDNTAFGRAYHQESQHIRTPLTTAFFRQDNLNGIQHEIERQLTEWAGIRVLYPMTEETAQAMADIIQWNAAYAFLGQPALKLMNSEFIRREVAIQKVSLGDKLRYQKWVLEGNAGRSPIFPYPASENHTRGEVTISTSGYQLGQQFWKDQRKCFFRDVYGMHVDNCVHGLDE